jgi:uncharacterized protein (TIGR00369 family)
MLLTPTPANTCFGCGGGNPRGMQLTYEQDDANQRIRGNFRLGAEYQGGGGFIHGGIIALVLDEAMGKVNRFGGIRAVTAELTIEYIRPIPVGEELVIEAHAVDHNGRSHYYVGQIANRAGKILAKAKARFVEVNEEKFKESLNAASAPASAAGNRPS